MFTSFLTAHIKFKNSMLYCTIANSRFYIDVRVKTRLYAVNEAPHEGRRISVCVSVPKTNPKQLIYVYKLVVLCCAERFDLRPKCKFTKEDIYTWNTHTHRHQRRAQSINPIPWAQRWCNYIRLESSMCVDGCICWVPLFCSVARVSLPCPKICGPPHNPHTHIYAHTSDRIQLDFSARSCPLAISDNYHAHNTQNRTYIYMYVYHMCADAENAIIMVVWVSLCSLTRRECCLPNKRIMSSIFPILVHPWLLNKTMQHE